MAYRQQQSFDGSTHELHHNSAPYEDQQGYDNGYTESPSRVRGGAGGYGATGGNDYGYSPKPKKRSKWLLIGLPIFILVVIAAVLGGVLGSRAANKNNDLAAGAANGTSTTTTGTGKAQATSTATDAGSAAASSAAVNGGVARFAVATDTYLLPVYPTTTDTAAYFAPTVSARSNHSWPTDPDSPSTATPRDHPRIIAPAYKWDALPELIAHDAYLASWNATIMANATANYDAPSITYTLDGGLTGSGVLDVARELKLRVKNWGYAWRMTKDTKWIDRAYTELNVAMGGDSSIPFGDGDTRWNWQHFLDVGEFTSAFGIAYDWMYDGFTDAQRTALRNAIVTFGLNYCDAAYTAGSSGANAWWTAVNGNWNCVINAGCTIGALAIQSDDTTGIAAKVLAASVTNAKGNCLAAVHEDGTWSETPNYWYFGTTGFAELTSAVTTAWGSDQDLLTTNENFHLTGEYHMYAQGMTSLFNYADHGPIKYTATANSLLFMGSAYNNPTYTLYQREQYDASEPFSMFWYEPSTVGAFWDGLALDHHFDSGSDDWASMRSTWTDNKGLYVAMKAGNMTGHQTHGDIDAGDFVLDAMGQRWAGELGSGNYLSTGYFTSEGVDAQRWLYYRKRTEGQNTIVLDYLNQNVMSQPPTTYGSSDDAQGSSTVMTLESGSNAFYTMDLTTAYNGTSILRGVRTLNQRKQVLVQTDITAPDATNIQWRMHTNATIAISTDGLTATLTLGGETMSVIIASPTTGAKFSQLPATRYASDPPLPTQDAGEDADQDNGDTTVLAIELVGGTYSLQVVFNPQWEGSSASDFVTPPSVAIGDWTLTSHN